MELLHSKELLQRVLACPLCKSIDPNTLKFKNNIIVCSRCHTKFQIKRINEFEIPDFYVKSHSEFEKLFWDSASEHYDDSVLKNPPPFMGKYEKWEDKILDTILLDVLRKEKVILLEIGSGTGRYLMRYGERLKKQIYPFTNLLAIIGVDFSEKMIAKSIENLEKRQLQKLINDRIFIIQADARNLPISFTKDPLISSVKKVVAIMFGTIGNIPTNREKLFEHLSSDLLETNAIGVISFFNKAALTSIGIEEYTKIPDVIGRPLIYFNEGIITTQQRGRQFFFTQWFDYNNFVNQIKKYDLKVLRTYKGPGFWAMRWIFPKKIPRGYIIKVKKLKKK